MKKNINDFIKEFKGYKKIGKEYGDRFVYVIFVKGKDVKKFMSDDITRQYSDVIESSEYMPEVFSYIENLKNLQIVK